MWQNYGEYLASREWALKKNDVLARAKGICERGHPHPAGIRLQVHHQSYEHVYDERLDELLAVCRECHEYLSAVSDIDPVEQAIPARERAAVVQSSYRAPAAERPSEKPTIVFPRWQLPAAVAPNPASSYPVAIPARRISDEVTLKTKALILLDLAFGRIYRDVHCSEFSTPAISTLATSDTG
jgi:hypothetical protein